MRGTEYVPNFGDYYTIDRLRESQQMTPGTNVSRLTEMNLHPIAIAGIGGLGEHSAPSGYK